MLGFPILHLKGPRIMMFQLSGFYYKGFSFVSLGALGFRGLRFQVRVCRV